jgi:hypothetical protein
MKRAVLPSLLIALLSYAAAADESPLAWVNAMRSRVGAPPVEADALLSKTASSWAGALAAAGVLSHRGADGSSALDRYRRLGGAEVRVGEILGAGPGLADIEAAWEKSPDHRPLVLKPYWTHVGWGSAPARAAGGDAAVFVVLFCQKLVDGLLIEERGGWLEVRGSFRPLDARLPALLAGIRGIEPVEWNPRERRFRFLVPPEERTGYLRLGYIGGTGGLVLTNAITPAAITSPPGKGSPEARGRFEAPAALP